MVFNQQINNLRFMPDLEEVRKPIKSISQHFFKKQDRIEGLG